MQHFGITEMLDDGTFWMCFEDWSREFNNLFVLRMYSDDVGEKFQRQEVSGQWTAETAGGCRNHPSWNTNPQYQLVSKQDTTVFVSLKLRNRRVARVSGDYPAHGVLVLNKTSGPDEYRKTFIQSAEDEVVFTPMYQAIRESSFELELKANTAYVLMPSTFDPKIVDNYYLTVFSRHPLTIQPLTKERSAAVMSGSWVSGSTAGGCLNNATWRSCPQFLLEVTADKALIPVVLEQKDIGADKLHFIGAYIFKAPGTPLVPRRTHAQFTDVDFAVPEYPGLDNMDLVAAPKLINASQCTTSAELPRGKYHIVCTTYKPNEENSFTLKVFSPSATLSPITKAWSRVSLKSEWKAGLNGGCVNNEATFMNNPKFLLKLSQKAAVHIVLCQDAKFHIGFNLFNDSQLQDYVDSSNYVNSASVSKRFDLAAGEYTIVPTTFQPGINSPFTLETYATFPHTLALSK
jgi:hypothetical protein